MAYISVLGTGTWGTALACLLEGNGHKVTMWSVIPSEIDQMKATRTHKNLPGLQIPTEISLTSNLQEAMEGKSIIVLAVPSIYIRSTAKMMKEFYKPDQIVVSVAKGIEENTLEILTDQIADEIPSVRVVALSGPSHAEEVAKNLPTTCVVGAYDEATAKVIQEAFMCKTFRVYISPDIKGIEIGGSIKNVIALAAGIADGLGYGDNTKAALITRGIAEIARLGVEMGGRIETFYGLSGIGDLIVTCASVHSRNRKAGYLMGQGRTMKEAMDEVQMVVEGVYSAKAAYALARKYNVSMPIVDKVYSILFEGGDPKAAVDDLMLREGIVENKALKWN